MKYYIVFVCIALASFNFKTNCLPSRQTDNRCQDQPNGSFLNHPLGCKYFIVCNNGEVNMGACPDGLAFNPLRPPCDLEENVDCSDAESTTETTTTTEVTTTEATTTRATTTDATTTEATTTSLPTTTASTSTSTLSTTVSTTTQSTIRPTTTQTTTSSTTSRPTTINPPTVTQISTSTTITTTHSTTGRPQLTTAEAPNPETKMCPVQDDPNQIIFLASDTCCWKYYICYHNNPVEMTCSSNLHWNQKTQKCDTIEEAKCTVSTMPSFFPVCPRDAIGIYPHPLNCEWFLYCYHGYMTVQQCPFFYHYDRETESCQLKTVAKCVLYSENN